MDTESLFPEEGWRDPCDDGERLAAYILFAVGGLAGLVGFGWSLRSAFDHTFFLEQFHRAHQRGDFWLCFVMGLILAAIAGGSLWFLAREWHNWNFRGINAERVVAGLFLTSVALGIIGIQMLDGNPPAMAIVFGLAGLMFVLSLTIGLAVIGFQALAAHPRRMGVARIVDRYALDDKLNRVEDCPCPVEDGLTPVVEMNLPASGLVRIRASASAYDLAQPGCIGIAIGTRAKLTEFKPERYRSR